MSALLFEVLHQPVSPFYHTFLALGGLTTNPPDQDHGVDECNHSESRSFPH